MQPAEYPKVYLYRRIVQAKLFIDMHFGNEIDLDNISDESCFSKFHFIRLFRKVYGETPHQYLTSVRIEKAKDFLKSDIAIAEVCFAVGFESVSSFTGLFKRRVGVAPSVYQELQKQIQDEIKEAPLNFIPHCFAESKGWIEKSNFQEVSL